MRMLALEALVIAAVLTVPPAPVAAPRTRTAMPWVGIYQRGLAPAGRGADARWRFASRVGAVLAWDLADLPRHQIGASQPWGVSRSSPSFPAALVRGPLPAGGGGAIGALITRWNSMYPPYAVEGTDDLERHGRRETDPSEEPSCPGN